MLSLEEKVKITNIQTGDMDRRQVLKTSAAAIPTLLAGCGQFTGNPDEELRSASEHIQKAGDRFESQAEGLGQVGETASFDPKPVRKELEAASAQLDKASEQASSEQAKKRIRALRALVTFLDALTASFVDLAAAQRVIDEGLSQYSSDEYQQATRSFEQGHSRLEKADKHYQKAKTALGDSDLRAVDIDTEETKAKLRESGRYLDAYRVFTGGATRFTRGMADFESGSSAFENDSFGSAKSSFTQASEHFSKASDRLAPPEGAPEELANPIAFLGKTATALGELSTAMVSMSTVMTSLQTVQSYLDASRYSDAITTLQSVQGEITTANNALDRAQTALSAVETSESLSAVELEQARKDFTRAESRFAALQPMVSGMIDFVKGTRALEKGSTDAQNDRYSQAATHFETAADHFGNAHQDFKQGEQNAPESMTSTFVDLVCQSAAYKDGSALYAEAYRAAANGNYDEANRKIEEGDKAFNRCSSGSSSGSNSADLQFAPL